jgi:hypothetical protein
MFNLSSQANLYLIVIIITTLINWICATVIFSWMGFLYYALIALILTPIFILYVYNVDCLTTGDCQIWSWIVAIFSAIGFISLTLFIVIITIFSSILQSFIDELKNTFGKESTITVESIPFATTTIETPPATTTTVTPPATTTTTVTPPTTTTVTPPATTTAATTATTGTTTTTTT